MLRGERPAARIAIVGQRGTGAAGGIRPHVLIVSDDPDLAGFLTEGLTMAGLWASVVASPFQALEVFRLRTFDVVLLDAALGGFGPVELLRRLRGASDRAAAGQPRTDVPAFVLAGRADEMDPAEAVGAGANGVFVAPLELHDLARTLIDAILRWREHHPNRPWADEDVLATGNRNQE